MVLLATSTLQASTTACEEDLRLRQKQVFYATPSITEELEEQPLKPNSNLVSTPLYYYTYESQDKILFKGERAVTPQLL
jgi:hypothetical protein